MFRFWFCHLLLPQVSVSVFAKWQQGVLGLKWIIHVKHSVQFLETFIIIIHSYLGRKYSRGNRNSSQNNSSYWHKTFNNLERKLLYILSPGEVNAVFYICHKVFLLSHGHMLSRFPGNSIHINGLINGLLKQRISQGHQMRTKQQRA